VIIIAGISAGVFILVTTAPPPPPAKTQIVVGLVDSETGGLAPQTATFDLYYQWIIQDIDRNGGLYVPEYGKKLNVTMIHYDDQSNINNMLALTTKLITVDKVDLMFGPVSTAFNFAAFPLYQQYQYPVIALTFGSDIAAAKMIDGTYSYCFSCLGMPSESASQVVQLFEYINTTKDKGQLNSVAVINDNDQHGVEYGGAIYAALQLAGFKLFPQVQYPTTITDFSSIIATLKSQNPDVVVLGGYEGGLFCKQCAALNFNPKLIVCGPSMETPFLVFGPYGFTPSNVTGIMLYDGWPSTAYNTPALQQWAYLHYNRTLGTSGFHWYPFPASATFYAACQCLFDAVQQVGLNRTAIRNALADDNFTTILGNTHLHQGYGMECSAAGTICQWTGQTIPAGEGCPAGTICSVVWPLSAASATMVYPKPAW